MTQRQVRRHAFEIPREVDLCRLIRSVQDIRAEYTSTQAMQYEENDTGPIVDAKVVFYSKCLDTLERVWAQLGERQEDLEALVNTSFLRNGWVDEKCRLYRGQRQ